jgi:hypothetical protein
MLREWSDRLTTRARSVAPSLQYVIGGVLALAMLFLVLLPFM